jgi:hypothetical protein
MRESTLRSWTNITRDSPYKDFTVSTNRRRHVEGLVNLIEGRIDQRWSPSFLTFQFEQLPGKAGAILRQMRTEIETIYRKLVCRVQRFPTTRLGSLNVPLLFSCADLPVPKHKKRTIAEVAVNGGLHHHGIFLLPPTSRLRTDLASHFADDQARYLAGSRLSSIFAEPIEGNLEKVVGYAFKGMVSGRLPYDDAFLVLPRSLSELA